MYVCLCIPFYTTWSGADLPLGRWGELCRAVCFKTLGPQSEYIRTGVRIYWDWGPNISDWGPNIFRPQSQYIRTPVPIYSDWGLKCIYSNPSPNICIRTPVPIYSNPSPNIFEPQYKYIQTPVRIYSNPSANIFELQYEYIRTPVRIYSNPSTNTQRGCS